MTQHKIFRVLIAEDDETVGLFVQRLLEDSGHSIVARVRDGRLAVEKTKHLHPDIVLMDIEMPELNGLEATRIIQEECPTPVILLTGYDDPEMVRKASKNGAGAYLLKPPAAGEIERTMIIAISRFEDLMELRRLNAELKSAMENVKILSGLLPVCGHCKHVRNDKGYWGAVERYLEEHTEVQISHSICPDCIEKFYPELRSKEVKKEGSSER